MDPSLLFAPRTNLIRVIAHHDAFGERSIASRSKLGFKLKCALRCIVDASFKISNYRARLRVSEPLRRQFRLQTPRLAHGFHATHRLSP